MLEMPSTSGAVSIVDYAKEACRTAQLLTTESMLHVAKLRMSLNQPKPERPVWRLHNYKSWHRQQE